MDGRPTPVPRQVVAEFMLAQRGGLFDDIDPQSVAKPIISRSRSASALFSTSARRFIMSSVIGVPSSESLASTTRPYRKAPMTTAITSYTTSRDVTIEPE